MVALQQHQYVLRVGVFGFVRHCQCQRVLRPSIGHAESVLLHIVWCTVFTALQHDTVDVAEHLDQYPDFPEIIEAVPDQSFEFAVQRISGHDNENFFALWVIYSSW